MTARKRAASKPAKTKAKAPVPSVRAAARKPSTRATNPAPRSKAIAAKPSAKVGAPAPGVKAVAPAPIVKVSAAKGRPMLSWVGKRSLREIPAYPAQEVERFSVPGPTADIDWSDWPDRYPHGGLLFHGDNKEVLAHLLANGFRGKADLVYIDPPFDSGADYVRRVELRGARGTARLDGEGYTLGEQIQYTDIWANDTYLQFMYERLLLLRELIGDRGSVYVHADARRVHHLRMLLDEVFGESAFDNQIAWQRTSSHGGANRFGAVTDYLLLYSVGDAIWHQLYQDMTETHTQRHYRHRDDRGVYALGELTAPGTRRGPTGDPWRTFNVTALGRHWARTPADLDRLDQAGRIYWPEKKGAWPRVKRYLDETKGRPATDFWDDIDPINMVGLEREGYPTQKPEALLERVILASSLPGAVVLDCFAGSGTALAVAQKLGRRWIGADINMGAIQTTSKRLMDIVTGQSSAVRQITLDKEEGETIPSQLSLATYRVNDYDLAIQHTEAVALAIEALGATRTQTDRFFDGTHGKKLLKIVPFDHPASPADLDEIARELRARPNEERDIVAVALGKVTACDGWLTRHNIRGAPNHIQLIELRTDPKYGKVFAHHPAKAKIAVKREGTKAKVVIQEFISPTIVERLTAQEGIVAPKITDWRQMVDSVMIDPSYDGAVFEVALADVPEKKDDFVVGTYEVDVSKGATTVAVKITDMLGEEVIVAAGI